MHIITKVTSQNYSPRTSPIKFIIIHYTALEFEEAIKCLCDPISQVSSHYIIKSDGQIFELVDPANVAWHAGISYWQGLRRINDYSIGIELDNLGCNSYSAKQMDSCINLCKMLVAKYNIPSNNILGHSDIAVERKIDPGIFFDWRLLAKHNIGIAHTAELHDGYNHVMFKFGDYGSGVLKLQQKLLNVGYRIELSSIFDLQTNFVIRSFQSHFNPKAIENLGLDFYQDPNSQYQWDEASNIILSSIL
jgi:N-acetylmuramoyl-L-alanine amidase